MKKLNTLLLALFLIISMSVPAMAESVPDYKGETTVEWAEKNVVKNGNKNWTDDCTVFSRLCLEAGGIPKDTNKAMGYAPGEYGDYLVDNGYADKIEDLKVTEYVMLNGQKTWQLPVKGNEGKVAPGDLLVNVCQNPSCMEPCHASIIADPVDGYWMHYQHIAHGDKENFSEYGRVQSARCFRCNIDDPSKIKFVCYHIKSAENGYKNYTGKVTGVKVKAQSYKKLKVSWKNLASATGGYNIFYNNKEVKYFRLAGHVKAGTTSFIYTVKDKNRYGQDVRFYIKPCKNSSKGGKTPDVGKKSTVVTGHTVPGMPKNVKGKRLADNKIRVTWKKGTGMKGARVEWRYKGTSRWYYGGTLTTNSFTKGGLKRNVDIQVRLQPFLKSKLGGQVYRNQYKSVTIKK